MKDVVLAQGQSEKSEQEPTGSRRLLSVDALRGLAIVVMLLAGNPFMRPDVPAQLKHPEWHGLRFADLFFPLFLFVVGIAMTLSRRTADGRQVARRVIVLYLIGVALTTLKHGSLGLRGVLQHIAGSYLLAWFVLRAPRRAQPVLAGGILLFTWLIYQLYAGGDDPWREGATAAHALEDAVFGTFSTEGVLQVIASSVTVLGGAFVGRGIRDHPEARSLARWVTRHAAWLLSAALLLAFLVPINKRIWTPSFTLLSLGTSCAFFAFFIWILDIKGWRRWSAPLRDLGANPIALYIGYIALTAVAESFAEHAPNLAPFGSETAGATIYCLGWLVLGVLVAHWLFRRKILIKI